MIRVLFVCVHNASRSQMAEAFFNHLAHDRGVQARAESAGTVGAGTLNPVVVEAMREIGMSMDGQEPTLLTQEMADAADEVVSMGCGVNAASCPAKFLVTQDWGLDDPAGQPIEKVREIRDQIRSKVDELIGHLELRTHDE